MSVITTAPWKSALISALNKLGKPALVVTTAAAGNLLTSAQRPADEQLDAAYSEIKSVISVGRGVGLWGDMVLTLRDGDKIELRSVPK